MRKCLFMILICTVALPLIAQTSSKYQRGTITAVILHRNSTGEPNNGLTRYDVSVRVDNIIYVVLYSRLMAQTRWSIPPAWTY